MRGEGEELGAGAGGAGSKARSLVDRVSAALTGLRRGRRAGRRAGDPAARGQGRGPGRWPRGPPDACGCTERSLQSRSVNRFRGRRVWLFPRDEASGSGESRRDRAGCGARGRPGAPWAAEPRADALGSSRSPGPPRAGAARSASRSPSSTRRRFQTKPALRRKRDDPASPSRREGARCRLECSSRGPQRSCTETAKAPAASRDPFSRRLEALEPSGRLRLPAQPAAAARAPRPPHPPLFGPHSNHPEKAPASLTTKSPICAPCSPRGASTRLASWETLAALTHDNTGRECAHRAGSRKLAARPAARPVLSVQLLLSFRV